MSDQTVKEVTFSEGMETGGILLLTNNENALRLYDWLSERERTWIYSGALCLEQIGLLKPDLVISYNYNYMIDGQVIDRMEGSILNLHISYLPWNRGFSPNIWSFIDRTPQGVTIHQLNEGLDKGKILYQERCCFDAKEETFATSYDKLNQMIVALFQKNWVEIRAGKYRPYEQEGKGSYHSKKDLELLQRRIKFDWDDNVEDFLIRYRNIQNGTRDGYCQ